MLEGAKLIRTGVATLSFAAGATIRKIITVFSSSIHSVARNLSLAKQSFIIFFALLLSFFPVQSILLMDELTQAVAPFLDAPGGGIPGSAGDGGGSGGSSFDVDLVAKGDDEEVMQPNHPALNFGLPDPTIHSVKKIMKESLVILRCDKNDNLVLDEEIDEIIKYKNLILERMFELDQSPFWNIHRNRLIRDFLQPNQGGEYRITTLKEKLESLKSNNPRGIVFQQLLKMKHSFYEKAPFRGPRGQ